MAPKTQRATHKRTKQAKKTPRTKKTKQTKRQRGGTQPTDEEIRQAVRHSFPEFHATVEKGMVRLFCQDRRADPIQFELTYPTILLHSLTKCPTIQGTHVLQRIIAVGRMLSFHTIQLDDASMVGCDYPLYTLSILQHGETWYHRMGFRSDDYEENKALHETLRHLPFEDFVRDMFRKHGSRISHTYTDREIDAYLEKWFAAFPETRKQTVAQMANRMDWKGIRCDDPRATLLRDFLFMADSALPYESYVSLDLRS